MYRLVMANLLDNLEVYLVGGAVRDQILGHQVKDRDWVVVGATPEQLLDKGFRAVGRDFPVFLHPETKEEYALARKERKIAPGYSGFDFDFSPKVSLEEDLKRRDLTINAMAQDKHGRVIDYFGGQNDLKQKRLRHVSEAFCEDPVRILRVARFRARYDFSIADETLALMTRLTASGEVDALVAERVWQELVAALSETHPSLFIKTLRDCKALARIFPEIDALFGIPQRADYHPEIDAGIHTLKALEQASILTNDPRIRFAVLVHDLGKALTPAQELPSHIQHEIRGLDVIKAMCQRIATPRKYKELALSVCRYHLHMHRLQQLKPQTIVKLLKDIGAFRDETELEGFILACQADAQGRTGFENSDYPQGKLLRLCYDAASQVNVTEFAQKHNDGQKISEELYRLRCEAIKKVLN